MKNIHQTIHCIEHRPNWPLFAQVVLTCLAIAWLYPEFASHMLVACIMGISFALWWPSPPRNVVEVLDRKGIITEAVSANITVGEVVACLTSEMYEQDHGINGSAGCLYAKLYEACQAADPEWNFTRQNHYVAVAGAVLAYKVGIHQRNGGEIEFQEVIEAWARKITLDADNNPRTCPLDKAGLLQAAEEII